VSIFRSRILTVVTPGLTGNGVPFFQTVACYLCSLDYPGPIIIITTIIKITAAATRATKWFV
jgi:hypothetical protein